MSRYLTEAIGTFFLVLTIGLTSVRLPAERAGCDVAEYRPQHPAVCSGRGFADSAGGGVDAAVRVAHREGRGERKIGLQPEPTGRSRSAGQGLAALLRVRDGGAHGASKDSGGEPCGCSLEGLDRLREVRLCVFPRAGAEVPGGEGRREHRGVARLFTEGVVDLCVMVVVVSALFSSVTAASVVTTITSKVPVGSGLRCRRRGQRSWVAAMGRACACIRSVRASGRDGS